MEKMCKAQLCVHIELLLQDINHHSRCLSPKLNIRNNGNLRVTATSVGQIISIEH